MTAIVTGLLFFIAMFVAPLAGVIVGLCGDDEPPAVVGRRVDERAPLTALDPQVRDDQDA